jgi:hypothetical protein
VAGDGQQAGSVELCETKNHVIFLNLIFKLKPDYRGLYKNGNVQKFSAFHIISGFYFAGKPC